MEQFHVYGLVALTAAILKTAILLQSTTRTKISSAFNIVCIAMILQNTFEFLGYFTASNNSVLSGLMVDGVMLSLYFVVASSFVFCCMVSGVRFARLITKIAWCSFAILVCLHFSGLIVTGYSITSYTIISVEGLLYPVFQLYVIAAIVTAMYSLSIGARSHSLEVSIRSKKVLLGMAPIAFIGLSVVMLRIVGFNSSTALLMPIVTTLFVWVILLDRRIDILTIRIKWKIIWSLVITIRNIKLSEWLELVEKQIIMEALRSQKNNKSAAAKLIGANKTTFHRKLEKYASAEKTQCLTEYPNRDLGLIAEKTKRTN